MGLLKRTNWSATEMTQASVPICQLSGPGDLDAARCDAMPCNFFFLDLAWHNAQQCWYEYTFVKMRLRQSVIRRPQIAKRTPPPDLGAPHFSAT